MIRQAVILCGGMGERLGDALRYCPAVEVPKPLIEVGGKPFISYAISMLKGIGFTDIVLLVLHKKELFEIVNNPPVRLVESQEDVSEAVLNIPNLEDVFLLLNGDCFPIMDWRAFVDTDQPRTAMKIVGRDAGCATIQRSHVELGIVSCSNIGGLVNVGYEPYTILGGLHVGTPQGLQRARTFMDLVVYGQ